MAAAAFVKAGFFAFCNIVQRLNAGFDRA